MDERTRDVLPLAAWLLSLGVAIVLFGAMGDGPLAAPPMTDPGAWGDWLDDRDGIVATMALLRLLVLAMAWYLVGVTTVGAVARVARWTRLVRVADALSVPLVRRVLQASLGVGLASAVVVSSGVPVPQQPAGPTAARPAAQSVEQPDAPTMRPVDTADPGLALDAPGMRPVPVDVPTMRTVGAADVDPSPGPTMTPLVADDAPAPPGMRPLPPAAPSATPDPAPPSPPATEAPDASVGARAPDTDASTVTSEAGDHLWSIAERHLADVLGGPVDDATVTDYWRRLVDANRDRLVDAGNPDLIYPGQQFVLPTVDGGTA